LVSDYREIMVTQSEAMISGDVVMVEAKEWAATRNENERLKEEDRLLLRTLSRVIMERDKLKAELDKLKGGTF